MIVFIICQVISRCLAGHAAVERVQWIVEDGPGPAVLFHSQSSPRRHGAKTPGQHETRATRLVPSPPDQTKKSQVSASGLSGSLSFVMSACDWRRVRLSV